MKLPEVIPEVYWRDGKPVGAFVIVADWEPVTVIAATVALSAVALGHHIEGLAWIVKDPSESGLEDPLGQRGSIGWRIPRGLEGATLSCP
jgi:hypothetical protein